MTEHQSHGTTARLSPFLQIVLSSSLVAALAGILFTLLGLLYRVGFLQAFGVSPDLFLPDSATELSYWGYMAALEMWAQGHAQIWSSSFWLWVAAVGILPVVTLNLQLAISRRPRSSRARLLKMKLRRNVWAQSTIASALTLLFVSAAPWVVIAVTALVVGLPLYGYSAGQRSAERVIAGYHKALSGNRDQCHTLTGMREKTGPCLLVVAQTKERIAFADGHQVHVIWSKDVEINWASTNLVAQPKTP